MENITKCTTDCIIDNRERDLIKYLESNFSEFKFSKDNLELGDIVFKKNGNVIVLIERKTLNDLSTSIKDGRYKEQKVRILNSISPSIRKIYLLEGNDMKCFKLPSKTFTSVIIHTIIRDNIHVQRTANLPESAQFILDISQRIGKIDFNEQIKSYSQICRPQKKANITHEVCSINMLQQIPGISNKLATAFFERYGNMQEFYAKFNDHDEFTNDLKDMKYGTGRKVGLKTAVKIAMFLFRKSH